MPIFIMQQMQIKKEAKKKRKKNVFENKKISGNEVAAFQNATNICGRSYCCTL